MSSSTALGYWFGLGVMSFGSLPLVQIYFGQGWLYSILPLVSLFSIGMVCIQWMEEHKI